MTDIYEVPEVATAKAAWEESKTEFGFNGSPETHNAFMQALRDEQVNRGQRSEGRRFGYTK